MDYGQNGIGRKDKMALDKMVWTKWCGQNSTDKMVAIFGLDYNSSEFNTWAYLVTKSMVPTQISDKHSEET